MAKLPGGYRVEVTGSVEMRDWRDDDRLSTQVHAMSRGRRHWAAYLALRRLHAPLTGAEMPVDWGVDPDAVATFLRHGGTRLNGEVNPLLGEAVDQLLGSFSGMEIEPELGELIQLEAIGGWGSLRNYLGELSEEQVTRLISLPREMSIYLDEFVDNAIEAVPGESTREQYLNARSELIASYELSYFGSRNLEIENACHQVILDAPEAVDYALADPFHSQLCARCDEFSVELLATLHELI